MASNVFVLCVLVLLHIFLSNGINSFMSFIEQKTHNYIIISGLTNAFLQQSENWESDPNFPWEKFPLRQSVKKKKKKMFFSFDILNQACIVKDQNVSGLQLK